MFKGQVPSLANQQLTAEFINLEVCNLALWALSTNLLDCCQIRFRTYISVRTKINNRTKTNTVKWTKVNNRPYGIDLRLSKSANVWVWDMVTWACFHEYFPREISFHFALQKLTLFLLHHLLLSRSFANFNGLESQVVVPLSREVLKICSREINFY